MSTSVAALKRANRRIAGTGFWLDGALTPTGRVRVLNEGEGAFCFHAKSYREAADRCIEKFEDDVRRSEEYDKLSKKLDLLGAKYVKNYGEENLVKMRAQYTRILKRLRADAVR
jgi:hypothetical protein